MTTKPTPTRKPTGRKAERPPTESATDWRSLKVGDALPPGSQAQTLRANRLPGPWRDIPKSQIGRVLDASDPLFANYRAPVASKRTKSATRKRWRALKAGSVCPRGYRWRCKDSLDWHTGTLVGLKLQQWHVDTADYRAPVTGKAKGRRK